MRTFYSLWSIKDSERGGVSRHHFTPGRDPLQRVWTGPEGWCLLPLWWLRRLSAGTVSIICYKYQPREALPPPLHDVNHRRILLWGFNRPLLSFLWTSDWKRRLVIYICVYFGVYYHLNSFKMGRDSCNSEMGLAQILRKCYCNYSNKPTWVQMWNRIKKIIAVNIGWHLWEASTGMNTGDFWPLDICATVSARGNLICRSFSIHTSIHLWRVALHCSLLWKETH